MFQAIPASHRMKGAGKMVGAMAFGTVCERIEAAGRTNDWMEVEANI
jgi:HPt (histidine-containing phosphotransfer) domain-containing protein